jgi:Berberine and berberine like
MARLSKASCGQLTHLRSAGGRAGAGAYPNFMMNDEGEACVKAAYGDNYACLTIIEKQYDLENLFQVNQSIKPADGADPVSATVTIVLIRGTSQSVRSVTDFWRPTAAPSKISLDSL